MTDEEQSLPNDIEQLKAMLLAERKQSAEQAVRLMFLEEQFRLA
jgi:transposase